MEGAQKPVHGQNNRKRSIEVPACDDKTHSGIHLSRAAPPIKITQANKTINIHNHPLVADLITQILTALEDHQEARLKVAHMIGVMKPNPKKPLRIEADYEGKNG